MTWKRTTIATLLLSFGMIAGAQAQDHDRDRDHDRRVYDAYHHDYHNWTPDEDHYYRQWYGNTYHDREYREYGRIRRQDQRRYWEWRHQQHEEREHEQR